MLISAETSKNVQRLHKILEILKFLTVFFRDFLLLWNVEVKIPFHIDLTTLDRELLDYIYKQTLIDFCLIYVATLDIIYWMYFDTS